MRWAEEVYHSRELVYWVEDWLTDDEFASIEAINAEADHFARSIPTGDHWV